MGYFTDTDLKTAKENLAKSSNRNEAKLSTGRYHVEFLGCKVDKSKKKGNMYFQARFKILKVLEAGISTHEVGEEVVHFESGLYMDDKVLKFIAGVFGEIPTKEDANAFIDPDGNMFEGIPLRLDNSMRTWTNKAGEEVMDTVLNCTGPLTKQQVADNGYEISKDILGLLD